MATANPIRSDFWTQFQNGPVRTTNSPQGGTLPIPSAPISGGSDSGSAGGDGAVPSWVNPQDAAFYQAVNQGWQQGGRGSSIPQDQYQYFLQRSQESAASGDPRDPSYWGMRASGLNEGSMSQDGGGGTLSGGLLGGATSGLVPGQGYVLPTAEQAQQYPGFQFALDQGINAINRSAAARGTLRSGGTLKDLVSFGTGLAAQDYGQMVQQQLAANAFNVGGVQGLANLGESAAALTGNLGANNASAIGGYLSNIGNANAANSIAQGNAWSSGITGGVNGFLTPYLYSRYINGGGGGGLGGPYANNIASAPSDFPTG